MKKYLISLLTIMMVAMVGFSFVSCSDDDDDNGSSNGGSNSSSNYSIVGTWRWDDDESDYYEIFTFRKDGTGTWTEYEDGESYSEPFSYQYYPSTHKLVIHAGDEVETSNVYINGDTMIWDGDIYLRVK